MCTVLLAHHVVPGWPLFVAANRDEFFDRASAPPTWTQRAQDAAAQLAPRDLRSGGTWIGLNDRGLVAVITNRSDLDDQGPAGARSRGLLVQGVLACPDLEAAQEFVAEDARLPSAPYNLLYGSVHGWFSSTRGSAGVENQPLAPGLHGVSNHGRAGDATVGEVRRALREWQQRFSGDPWSTAREVLSLSEPDDGLPPLLKSGRPDRGTRSSSIIGIDSQGQSCYLHANGPPNITEFVEIPSP